MRNSILPLVFCLPLLGTAKEHPPNVVLIFADDLGYGDLGCYGATKLKTPNIDKLAAEGRRFTDAHSAAAVCTPSRFGLLTGQHPFRANGGRGIWGPAPVTSPLLIPPDTLTVADIFKEAGYATAVFGKWHLGFKTGRNDWQEPLRPGPQDLGFDYYFGMPVVNSAPPYVYVENDKIVGGDPDDPLVLAGRGAKDVTPITPIKPEEAQRSPNAFRGAAAAHKLFNDYEVGTKLTEKATGWIKERGDKPFFCFLSTTAVHHPFTPAPRFQGSSDCGVYGDFVHELDWMVGEVMKTLEAQGVADNTLVLFTSDNGGMFNLGGRAAAAEGHKINGELLGSKFGIWEGGHRVPFIARWPGKIEPGTVSDQLLCGVDLLASFAALTGKHLGDAERKDSINMLPALTGNPAAPLRSEMFMTPHKPSHMALRQGKWMYIPARSDGGFTGSKPGQHAWGGPAVTKLVGTPNSDIDLATGTFKKDAPNAQLYDLEADRNQTRNLINDHPDVARELAAALEKVRPKAAGKRNAASGPAPPKKYDGFKPIGNLRYSFESGKLDGWTLTEGRFGQAVTPVRSLARRKDAPFARHGDFHLSTLVLDDGKSLADTQTGVLKSPTFKLSGNKASFLVGGGYDEKTLYVALVDAISGEVLIKAGGGRDPHMRRVVWDVSKWSGSKVCFAVVDRSTGGWGHLNVDDFSVAGEPASPPGKPAAAAEQSVPAAAKNPPRPATSKPNFIVIFTDDQGYGDLSCYGGEHVSTPRIDQMAKEGARLTSFYVAAPVCTPSRAALVTGCYPKRIDMATGSNFPVLLAGDKKGLNPAEVTIAEVLKSAGYKTGIFGKWHLGDQPEFLPTRQGFDEFFGIPYSHDIHSFHPRQDRFNFPLLPLLDGETVVEMEPDADYLTRRFTRRAVQFIEKHKDEPFFVYLPHPIPHVPLHVSPPFMEGVDPAIAAKLDDEDGNIDYRTRNKLFRQAIAEIDWSVGQVLDALQANGVDQNTLVIFTADNGPAVGNAGALRGKKGSTFEGGMREPTVIRWPGTIPAGKDNAELMTTMDLLPTFAKLAGAKLPTDRTIDGKDISAVLRGEEKSPHDRFFYHGGNTLRAVRSGQWKLHWNSKKPTQLYNLETDIAEKNNLIKAHPEIVKKLTAYLHAFENDIAENNRPAAFVDNPKPLSK